MRRPASAREALGVSPPLEACRTQSSRVEGVPLMTAGARPLSSLRGNQPHRGHRMREPEEPRLFSSSSISRSRTVDNTGAPTASSMRFLPADVQRRALWHITRPGVDATDRCGRSPHLGVAPCKYHDWQMCRSVGSASTMVAAEQPHRTCYALPQFVMSVNPPMATLTRGSFHLDS
jgi:hypothetical protein